MVMLVDVSLLFFLSLLWYRGNICSLFSVVVVVFCLAWRWTATEYKVCAIKEK